MQVKAKKHLGQNFLTSKDVVNKIVKSAKITNKDTVLEIGPGLGILTIELAKHAKKVISIELDTSIIPTLKKNLENELSEKDLRKITILNEDALKFTANTKTVGESYKIVANIPYYITSPLISHFLTSAHPPKSTTILVQKEVAIKICAQTAQFPKEMHSILSLATQIYAKPNFEFTVLAGSFSPAPKVDSAVIHLETHKKTLYKNPDAILSLAKRAFTGKRKKLSNTLRSHLAQLKKLNLQDSRPERLTLKQWQNLVDHL